MFFLSSYYYGYYCYYCYYYYYDHHHHHHYHYHYHYYYYNYYYNYYNYYYYYYHYLRQSTWRVGKSTLNSMMFPATKKTTAIMIHPGGYNH